MGKYDHFMQPCPVSQRQVKAACVAPQGAATMERAMRAGAVNHVYGHPDPALAGDCGGAVQYSPLVPGSAALEAVAPGILPDLVVLAPPATIERRCVIAQALRAISPDGALTVLAPKDKGGARLAGDFRDLGCAISEEARRHHRICHVTGRGDDTAIEAAIAAGAPRFVEGLGLWSQPGIFSWDRGDPGSALLLEHLPALAGKGADLGCGLGLLARAVLASPKVEQLDLIDTDRRAVEMARRNIKDARAHFVWADARQLPEAATLDFIVMNAPFHDAGHEDKALGQAFIQKAAALLRRGGACWLTANRHLPYEAMLNRLFRKVETIAEAGGYKIIQAVK